MVMGKFHALTIMLQTALQEPNVWMTDKGLCVTLPGGISPGAGTM